MHYICISFYAGQQKDFLSEGLFFLVSVGKACEFKEPILLVGETGCGKTTLCQLLAASRNQDLATVNCHMHSESADFLGGLRPVREHSEVSCCS